MFYKFLVDNIFYLLFTLLFVLVFVVIGVAEHERVEFTAKCYDKAMVLVDTDAGSRCVLPADLVR
jgi:hypothetical protein